jgi:ABC-type transport system involved in cytochrome bd biosynthesis fused ATPase/permease subunit
MLNQAGIPLYETQATEPEEAIRSYSPEKTERILALLTEYTEKLKAGYDELQMRRQRLLVTSTVFQMFVGLTVWVGVVVAYAMNTPKSGNFLPTLLCCVIVFVFLECLFTLYRGDERQHQRELHDSLKALARRLEPLTRWAVQIHEHAERDEIRRLELNLRLTEARIYIEQVAPQRAGEQVSPVPTRVQ